MILLAGTPKSWAGGSEDGTISVLTSQPTSNTTFINLTGGTSTDRPACATSGRFALDTSKSAGRTTLAILIGAFVSGKTVVIYGLGTCNTWSDSEDVSFVYVYK